MSKITFRADDDLVEELEALETSKSEAMREALRSYLDAPSESERSPERDSQETAIDDLVRERVDDLLTDRLEPVDRTRRTHAREPQDVNVTISLEGVDDRAVETTNERERVPPSDGDRRVGTPNPGSGGTQCGQCGEHVDDDHVYCPNCGEKASHRLFCECGDELRSDWAFCPSCGRRTPAADVLESG
ncbi:double zinc ribbon domain-containing protein [Natrarchaeobius chitinivorans]|uniref:Ribbon-helix-helix protein, CopG family n=1 Tax=Natrarchaeobius chitinivorans TaxID=1679083 RepID=A0A3N6M087_NATCH|nr:zinc ribbon domain-containing protein [Natrarchaeobius chitinivorans]RQG96638.1 ribbon-helix-helix protein, CopG family [Natrarchaeobius chitinivorans]